MSTVDSAFVNEYCIVLFLTACSDCEYATKF